MRDIKNRRDFLKQVGSVGLGLSLAPHLVHSTRAADAKRVGGRTIGANDTINVAVIGTNSRGLAHIDCLAGLPGVQITYICDVDDRAIASGIKATAKGQSVAPKGAKDFRKVLEDKSLDAVT